MNPEYTASIAFLKRWKPEGPWVLTAINVDRKGIETKTFRPANETDLLSWLEEHNQTRNIYFSVNSAIKPELTKKALREEIATVDWLHVDVDPRVGEDVAEEQKRILKLFQNPPEGVPPATAIIFSGGGYQAFWKLEEPIEVNGQVPKAEEAARYNLQLEMLFGADPCHNIDRIMRLPGTINWPDEKKRKKGRTKALAQLIEWHEDRTYPISQFTSAQAVQTAGIRNTSGRHPVEISGNIERLSGVDDPRLTGVSDLAKVVIVQGHDPEDPEKFMKDGQPGKVDRSKALFFVCCRLVDAGCDDDTIYAVITDPDFRISSSVLDKGSMSEKYAIKQIRSAREAVIDPQLEHLNSLHAVISNWNGKCRVIEEVWDPNLKRYKLTKQSFEDFRNRYMNQRVVVNMGDDKVVHVPLGKWWLQHKHRRQFKSIVFAPGQDVEDAYNLWRGFACEAIPGNCEKSLLHIKNNICGENEDHYRYLLGWMASAVQYPDRPGYSAIVLRGGQGIGKGFFTSKIFGSLFGRHFLQVSDPKHIVGSFNAHLRDCVILFGDEAFYAGDKKHESILKMLVTEDMLIVEPKGVDAEMSANCVHLLMASNETWVVPAALDDRRFLVLDVGSTNKGDRAYFSSLETELDNGGREALLHFLMNYDLSNYDVRAVPKTKALQEQKLHSMNIYEEWWFEKLSAGLVLDNHSGWKKEVPQIDLRTDFLRHAKAFNVARRGNSTKLTEMLKKFMPVAKFKVQQRATPIEIQDENGHSRTINRPYFCVLPTLEECRKHWDENFGGPYTWDKPLTEDDIGEIPF